VRLRSCIHRRWVTRAQLAARALVHFAQDCVVHRLEPGTCQRRAEVQAPYERPGHASTRLEVNLGIHAVNDTRLA